MLMGELITVAAHKLPVNVVVFNNSTLGMVKLEMLVDGLPDFGVDVPDANYAEVAKAWGSMPCASRIRRTSRQRTGRLLRTPPARPWWSSSPTQCPVHPAENFGGRRLLDSLQPCPRWFLTAVPGGRLSAWREATCGTFLGGSYLRRVTAAR